MLVDNQPNVLARISSLFGRRNFNISTITASETHISGLTRITVVTGENDENVLHQIIAQTEKLEVVREIYLLDMKNSVYRELLLVKIRTDKNEKMCIRDRYGDTEQIFSMPKDKRTEDYITGRFG